MVLDSDWGMCMWASADPALTRRIIAARGATQFAHAYLPRELHGLMRAAGLTLADAQAFSIVETRHDPDGIAPEEVVRWVEELRSRTAAGDWFFCLNRFVFTATK